MVKRYMAQNRRMERGMQPRRRYASAKQMAAEEEAMSVVQYKGKLYYFHPEYGYVPVERETESDREPSRWAENKSKFYYQSHKGEEEEEQYWEYLDALRKEKERKKRKKMGKAKKSRKKVNNFLKEANGNQKSVKRKKKIVSRKKTKGKKKLKEKEKKVKKKVKEKVNKENEERPKTRKKGKKKIRLKAKPGTGKKPKKPKIKPQPKVDKFEDFDAKTFHPLQNEKSYEVVTGYEVGQFEEEEAQFGSQQLNKNPTDDLGNLEELDLIRKETQAPPNESKKDSRSFREDEYEQKLLSMGTRKTK